MRFNVTGANVNLFRYYRIPSHWENNITRALVCCIAKSVQRYAVTSTFLRMVADSPLQDSGEVPSDIRETLCMPQEILANIQDDVSDWKDREGSEEMQPVLVLLEPRSALEERQARAEAEGKSRADATLTVSSEAGKNVFVVIENKRSGRADNQQIGKYKKNLGIDVPVAHLAWQDLYSRLNVLADDLGQGDPVLQDFLELVARNPNLAGFTGLTQEHLEDGGSSWTKNMLRLLAKECVSEDRDQSPVDRLGKEFPRGSSMDIDLYLPNEEQVRMVGNIGIQISGRGRFQVKLIVGDFRYDPQDEEGEKGNAQYETHRGTCDLCQHWDERRKAVQAAWEKLVEAGGRLRYCARARRRRVQDISHYNVLCREGPDFSVLEETVKVLSELQPQDKGREIDEKVFGEVEGLIEDEADTKAWREDKELLIAGSRYLTGTAACTFFSLGVGRSLSRRPPTRPNRWPSCRKSSRIWPTCFER